MALVLTPYSIATATMTTMVSTKPHIQEDIRDNLYLYALKFALEEVEAYNDIALEKKHKMSLKYLHSHIATEVRSQASLTRFTEPHIHMYMFCPYVISTLYWLLEESQL
jgi:hypothetical protein